MSVGTDRERALVLLPLDGELTGCAADWNIVVVLGTGRERALVKLLLGCELKVCATDW